MILIAATFVGILVVVVGAYWAFVLRFEEGDRASLRKRLQPLDGATTAPVAPLLKPTVELSSVGRLNSTLGHLGRFTAPLQRDLTQAGLNRLTVGKLLLLAACLALGGYMAVKLLTFNPGFALVAGAACGATPFLYVRHAKTKRLRTFEEQFPEAIDLIGRALRAGHTFTTGLLMAADEIPAPVGEEFKLLYDRQAFGMPLPEAMKAFAERVPLIDARFFATAVLTQRETGGNLGEILDNLSSVIRERFKVKRQVRVLTAHGRITGWVLAGLPPALAGVIFVIAPGHMQLLTSDPLGVQMIMGAVVMQIAGTLVIRKLVDIRY